MLLPNMSMKEIRKEIEEELPILRRRTEYVATGLKYSRNVKSNVALAGTFNYCSEFQNTWYVIFPFARNAGVTLTCIVSSAMA